MGVPGRVVAIALNTYRETVRDKVLYNLVVFALLLIGASFLLARISIGAEVKIIKDLGLAAVDAFGTVIAIVVGIRLVSRETERRTLYGVLAKPVTRAEFLVGKYLGLCLLLLVDVAIMVVAVYAVLFYMTRTVEPALLKAVYLTYWQLVVVAAVGLFFSSCASFVLSGVGTVFVYVAGHFAEDLRGFDRFVTSPVLPKVTAAASYLLPNMTSFDVKGQVVHGEPVPWAQLGWVTVYAVLYVTAMLTLAILAFRRRDLR